MSYATVCNTWMLQRARRFHFLQGSYDAKYPDSMSRCHCGLAHLSPLSGRPQCFPHILGCFIRRQVLLQNLGHLLGQAWGLSQAARQGVACGWVDQAGCCPKCGDGLSTEGQGSSHWDVGPLLIFNFLNLRQCIKHSMRVATARIIPRSGNILSL